MPVITPVTGSSLQLPLLTIVQRAMGQMGLARPTYVIGNTDRTVAQILDLLQALGDDLVQGQTLWQLMVREYVFNLVAAQTQYAFPKDMVGMSPGTGWDRTTRFSMAGPLTGPEWQFLKSWGVIASPRYQFRIFQDYFQIQPTPDVTDQMVFEYLSGYWIRSAGAYVPAWLTDADVCAFPNQLAINGLKMRFLQTKKLPNSEETDAYNESLELAQSMNAGLPYLGISSYPPAYLITDDNIPPTGYGQ